jgi:hypothetical protein
VLSLLGYVWGFAKWASSIFLRPLSCATGMRYTVSLLSDEMLIFSVCKPSHWPVRTVRVLQVGENAGCVGKASGIL